MDISSPRLLAIDTSGPQATIEMWSGPSLLAAETFGVVRHVQLLTGRLKQLLAICSMTAKDIDAIAINVGPGSFTGIRVGLATVKALAYVDGPKLIGVDCFDVWAAGVEQQTCCTFAVIIEGQMQTANIVAYEFKDGELVRKPLRTIPRGQLAGECAGTAVIAIGDRMRSCLSATSRLLDVRPHLAKVAQARLLASRFDDPFTLEPYYVRPSSAEEKWDAR